jgi:tRNA threonylcarbamoyladenosine biosynthesis protein TsaE
MSKAGWKRKVRANYLTGSAKETEEIGRRIAQSLTPGGIVALQGDLGAGKTTLVKGLAAHCTGVLVNSPTFTYLQIYSGTPPIFHFDLYRLKNAEEFLKMGFSDYLEQGGICCIEWAERIRVLLPAHTVFISLEHAGDGKRRICVRELE